MASKSKCIHCDTEDPGRPNKGWLSGPSCYRCYQKAYHLKNKAKHNSQSKATYEQDKAKYNKLSNSYRITHKAELNQRSTQRRKNDMNFRLAGNLRNRLRQALKRNSKAGSAVADLGCSIDELRHHLEQHFALGMTWENYGITDNDNQRWSIDHVIPLVRFDLSNEVELKRACHFSNLRPIWSLDNSRKHDKDAL